MEGNSPRSTNKNSNLSRPPPPPPPPQAVERRCSYCTRTFDSFHALASHQSAHHEERMFFLTQRQFPRMGAPLVMHPPRLPPPPRFYRPPTSFARVAAAPPPPAPLAATTNPGLRLAPPPPPPAPIAFHYPIPSFVPVAAAPWLQPGVGGYGYNHSYGYYYGYCYGVPHAIIMPVVMVVNPNWPY